MIMKVANPEILKSVYANLKTSQEQEQFWDDFVLEFNSVKHNIWHKAKIVGPKVFEATERFPDTFLLRRMHQEYAKRLERIGTYHMTNRPPLERSDFLVAAADQYFHADKILGYVTDNAFREFECCNGAAQFRREAGLDIEIEKLGLVPWAGEMLAVGLSNKGAFTYDIPPAIDIRERVYATVERVVNEKVRG